jgi:prolyl oligopeptidase
MTKVGRISSKSNLLAGALMAIAPFTVYAQAPSASPIKASDMIGYTAPGQTDADHLYLEEVLGDKAIAEVKTWNERSLNRLTSDPRFAVLEGQALEILNSKDKIPYVSYRNGETHNFWQDAQSVRGVWRKSTLESYLSADTKWETVLDFDALATAEGKNWVYKGRDCLSPEYEHCMVSLSDGGKDAAIQREFNAPTKSWVEGGFITKESKGGSTWLDKDTQLVGVDFGPGTMTASGYPMTARIWKRGEGLGSAQEFMRGEPSDVGLWTGVHERADGSREIVVTRAEIGRAHV